MSSQLPIYLIHVWYIMHPNILQFGIVMDDWYFDEKLLTNQP